MMSYVRDSRQIRKLSTRGNIASFTASNEQRRISGPPEEVTGTRDVDSEHANASAGAAIDKHANASAGATSSTGKAGKRGLDSGTNQLLAKRGRDSTFKAPPFNAKHSSFSSDPNYVMLRVSTKVFEAHLKEFKVLESLLSKDDTAAALAKKVVTIDLTDVSSDNEMDVDDAKPRDTKPMLDAGKEPAKSNVDSAAIDALMAEDSSILAVFTDNGADDVAPTGAPASPPSFHTDPIEEDIDMEGLFDEFVGGSDDPAPNALLDRDDDGDSNMEMEHTSKQQPGSSDTLVPDMPPTVQPPRETTPESALPDDEGEADLPPPQVSAPAPSVLEKASDPPAPATPDSIAENAAISSGQPSTPSPSNLPETGAEGSDITLQSDKGIEMTADAGTPENGKIKRVNKVGLMQMSLADQAKVKRNPNNPSKINGFTLALDSIINLHSGNKRSKYIDPATGKEVLMSEVGIMIAKFLQENQQQQQDAAQPASDDSLVFLMALIQRVNNKDRDICFLTNFLHVVVAGLYWAGVKELNPTLDDESHIMPIEVTTVSPEGREPGVKPVDIVITASYFCVIKKVMHDDILKWMYESMHKPNPAQTVTEAEATKKAFFDEAHNMVQRSHKFIYFMLIARLQSVDFMLGKFSKNCFTVALETQYTYQNQLYDAGLNFNKAMLRPDLEDNFDYLDMARYADHVDAGGKNDFVRLLEKHPHAAAFVESFFGVIVSRHII